jgi:hypothetical protein
VTRPSRAVLLLALAAGLAGAQDFVQRGFLDLVFSGYPQTALNDSSRATGDALLRYEAFYKRSAWRFSGGIDARTDTHRQDLRDWHLSWEDREIRRPAFEVRRLSVSYTRGPVLVEAGRQFIRWGKADILNPTDRFAPRDFLNVVDNDFLAVTAGRVTIERGADTADLVIVPLFAPSRIPLLNQRWAVMPAGLPPGLRILDAGARYPGRAQFGARWNHLGAGYEFSLSFYDGFNNLPLLGSHAAGSLSNVYVERVYPQMRMYGGDVAIPLRQFTVKAEAGYFTSRTAGAGDYALYVIQAERQQGEWTLVGGYAGEADTTSTRAAGFAPDRGLARAFLGRATYTIDTNRSLAFQAAVRQNGSGVWLESEYSHALGRHLRAIASFTLIRGDANDFLGQYRRNSHARVTFRYSF